MNWKPLTGRVLIEPDRADETTKSGLAIVQHWPEEVSGTVIAAGPKTELIPGDWAIFSEFAPRQTFRLDDHTYLVMRETDLLAVWDEEEAHS